MGGINQFCDAGILKVQCNTVHKAGQNPIMPGPSCGRFILVPSMLLEDCVCVVFVGSSVSTGMIR